MTTTVRATDYISYCFHKALNNTIECSNIMNGSHSALQPIIDIATVFWVVIVTPVYFIWELSTRSSVMKKELDQLDDLLLDAPLSDINITITNLNRKVRAEKDDLHCVEISHLQNMIVHCEDAIEFAQFSEE
jgi:hypothetical protein